MVQWKTEEHMAAVGLPEEKSGGEGLDMWLGPPFYIA
jgi:hypothetical protein